MSASAVQGVTIAGRKLEPTPVFHTYWRFAAERQRVYESRVAGLDAPWTTDPVISRHRFTNVFRAADRVSQYLITHVQSRAGEYSTADLVFRTLLFKIFNRIGTWQHLEASLGDVRWASYEYTPFRAALDDAAATGPIYSPAYVMPPPNMGEDRKHANHLRVLEGIMREVTIDKILRATSLSSLYELLLDQPGLGPFLAFQYAIDLNYLAHFPFDEDDYVVAGPGARDGIRKVFGPAASGIEAFIIRHMVEHQDRYFADQGLEFTGLFGRPLHLIDAQNLFCEVDKYARVAHPEIAGISGRSRIKQSYANGGKLPRPSFPEKWHLSVAQWGSSV